MTNRGELLTILWRGSLSSCNYACTYCPFAKTKNTRSELNHDRAALQRFAKWTGTRNYPMEVLITPWGEALIRKYYREVLTQLSHQANIQSVAIQTNLSCSLKWLSDCNLSKIALWTTFHPGETTLEKFVSKIAFLDELNVRFSVGLVGTKQNVNLAKKLHNTLPERTYMWINADRSWPIAEQKATGAYNLFANIDPLFPLNTRRYPVLNMSCRAGQHSISVAWDGTAQRCHFIKQKIGNIYDENFESQLFARPCTAGRCDCHIGYSNLDALQMRGLYDGFIERRAHKHIGVRDAEICLERFRKAYQQI